MTVRQRVIASRLIQKVEYNKDYADKIGISYSIKRKISQLAKEVQKTQN